MGSVTNLNTRSISIPNQPKIESLRKRRNRSTKKRVNGLGVGGHGQPPSNKQNTKPLQIYHWIQKGGPYKFKYPSMLGDWYNDVVKQYCYQCGIGVVDWIVCDCQEVEEDSDQVEPTFDQLLDEVLNYEGS